MVHLYVRRIGRAAQRKHGEVVVDPMVACTLLLPAAQVTHTIPATIHLARHLLEQLALERIEEHVKKHGRRSRFAAGFAAYMQKVKAKAVGWRRVMPKRLCAMPKTETVCSNTMPQGTSNLPTTLDGREKFRATPGRPRT
jgi:hypothetical protein